MENEGNFYVTRRPLMKSTRGDTSMSSRNTSIQDLSADDILEILVRLPVKTIIHCKCVCNEWLNLIRSSHFINFHLTNSPESIMLLQYSEPDDEYTMNPIVKPKFLRLVEIQHELGRNHLHHDPIMSLDLNLAPAFQYFRLFAVGSVNGLICLLNHGWRTEITYICNPITREYMILPKPQYYAKNYAITCYGFGINSLTGEYKVIQIFQDIDVPIHLPVEAEIYTLGTGQWRSLGHVTYSVNESSRAFLNNHLHWTICDFEDSLERIYAFDLDKETFQIFPSPPESIEENVEFDKKLGVLKDCLCYSCCSSFDVSIWVMKEYGIKNSWQKEVSVKESISAILRWSFETPCFPVGRLKDGSILMVYGLEKLLVYHPDRETIEETEFSDYFMDAMNYRPSFLKLQNFKSENVHEFQR